MTTGLSGEDVRGIVAWSIATTAALLALRAAAPGRRLTWGVVAIACAVIVLDNAVGVQEVGLAWAKAVLGAFELDVSRVRHPRARIALLAVLVVGGSSALLALVRADRPCDGPRRMSLAGLLLVIAYLGARLTSQLGGLLNHEVVSVVVKGTCFLLVTAGALWHLRRRARAPG